MFLLLDEPSSPSNEVESSCLPPRSMISQVSPRVTSSAAIVLQRQLSHDQGKTHSKTHVVRSLE